MEKGMKNCNARKVFKYYQIYKQHLLDNNLEDDSDLISVEDLVNYVENHIEEELKDEYIQKIPVLL